MVSMLRLIAISLLSVLLMAARMPVMRAVPWQVVDLPVDNTLLDIAFAGTDHGWIVGDKGLVLESYDAGINWQEKSIPSLNPDSYLVSVSFHDNEGWIIGQPRLMFHTINGGETWEQIILSNKLPGEPLLITALGPDTAEFVTDIGAIYRTTDAGLNWKAMVNDAIGAFKNVARDPASGSYLGVSSRGSFYFLYQPEKQTWQPFNRESSRRIQNMGFGFNGRAWKLNQGAEITLTDDLTTGEWSQPIRPGRALSFGYLGAAYQDEQNLWVVGGSATLIHSSDGGETWEKARKVSNVPANFYAIKFPQPDQGFILGQRGALLRYIGNS